MSTMTPMSHHDAEQIAQRNFYVHLGVYLAVNSGLAVLNLTNQPDKIWFVWPLAGWGLGVALHGVAVFVTGKAAERVQFRQERRENRLEEREKIAGQRVRNGANNVTHNAKRRRL